MAKPIIMPRQGQSVESCIINKWMKKVGDKVEIGDILFSYETDKSAFEEDAKEAGTLLAILAEEGDDVPCLENVAVIGEEGEDISEFLNGSAPSEAPATTEAPKAETCTVAPAELPADCSYVIMPRQGQSVESCIINKWMKKVGDKVSVGDILFSYETDKSAFEEEAKVEGTVLAILAEEGDDVPCLDNVAIIGKEGTDVSACLASASVQDAPQQAQPVNSSVVAAAPVAATGSVKARERIKISPRAKGEAERRGLDYTKAIPTGPDGRIIERDIVELSKHAPAEEIIKEAEAVTTSVAPVTSEASYEDVPLSNVRKVIAKAMHKSLSEGAQLTHTFSFDATNMLALRKQFKASAETLGLANITLNDIILFAVSRVLLNHKDLNANYLDDKMRYFKDVNLGMAVDTPRGLLVPVIKAANKLSLNEIAIESKRLAKAAQEGNINPDDLNGGSFTVSNLGSFGVESFTPVINPPQTGILGVDTITTRVRIVDGEMKAYQAMGISLTYDHRALDGAPASRFAQELCRTLENIQALLAK